MSDDLSTNDIMVLQNAIIDDNMRKITMQSHLGRVTQAERQRSQQAPRTVYCLVLEKEATPLIRLGYVTGGVYFKHRYGESACSLRRDTETFKFDSSEDSVAFIEAREQRNKDLFVTPCPECYPEFYKNGMYKQILTCIMKGVRAAGQVPPVPGYYVFQDKKISKLLLRTGVTLDFRFFHPAGCQCRMHTERKLLGPYTDIEDAFDSLDARIGKRAIQEMPCPYCYAETAYTQRMDFKALHGLIREALDRFKDSVPLNTAAPPGKPAEPSKPVAVNEHREYGGMRIKYVDGYETSGEKGKGTRLKITIGMTFENKPTDLPELPVVLTLLNPKTKNKEFKREWKGKLEFQPSEGKAGTYYITRVCFDMNRELPNGEYIPSVVVGNTESEATCKINNIVIKRSLLKFLRLQ